MPDNLITALDFLIDFALPKIAFLKSLISTEPLLCLGIMSWCIGANIGLFKKIKE